MSTFSGPAAKSADSQLFGRHAHTGSAAINKQSRAELRQKARERYWLVKQTRAANQAAAANADV